MAGKVFTGDEDPVPFRPRDHHDHAQVPARPAGAGWCWRREEYAHPCRPRLPDGARRPAVAHHGREGRRAPPGPPAVVPHLRVGVVSFWFLRSVTYCSGLSTTPASIRRSFSSTLYIPVRVRPVAATAGACGGRPGARPGRGCGLEGFGGVGKRECFEAVGFFVSGIIANAEATAGRQRPGVYGRLEENPKEKWHHRKQMLSAYYLEESPYLEKQRIGVCWFRPWRCSETDQLIANLVLPGFPKLPP